MKLQFIPVFRLSVLLPLLLAGCSGADAPDATGSPADVSLWQPATTRAIAGDVATIAGYASADASAPAFSADVEYRADNIWYWQSGSYTPPLSGVKVLAASIPAVSMTRGTATLFQYDMKDYSRGLMLGAVPYADGVTVIPVHHRLARIDISCKGSHWLNSSLYLYLANSADVDFPRSTLTTNAGKSDYHQQMQDSRTATIPIFPQTFHRGDVLFHYRYGSSTYSYTLKKDYVVGANQCLYVKIASGDEDSDPDPTPPDPPVVDVEISLASIVSPWEQGGSQSGDAE